MLYLSNDYVKLNYSYTEDLIIVFIGASRQ